MKNKFLNNFCTHYAKLPRNEKNYPSFETRFKNWLVGQFSVNLEENENFLFEEADDPPNEEDEEAGGEYNLFDTT